MSDIKLLTAWQRHEFVPVLRYGNWAGQGYAGGVALETVFQNASINNGQPITGEKLCETPAGLAYFMQQAIAVQPNGYLDNVTRNHDVEYTISEIRFMNSVQAQFEGRLPHQLTSDDKNSSAYKQLVQEQNQEYWQADKRMLNAVADYKPTDFADIEYRSLMIDGFYVKASNGMLGYGFKDEATAFFETLKTKDASITVPTLGQMVGSVGRATVLMRSDFEELVKSDLTPQERQFFNQHLQAGAYLDVSTKHPESNPIPIDQINFSNRLVVPYKNGDNYEITVKIDNQSVTMKLDRTDKTNPIFTKEVRINGILQSIEITTPTDSKPDDYGNRAYTVTKENAQDNVLQTSTIAKPNVPKLDEPADLTAKLDAVNTGNYASVVPETLTNPYSKNAVNGLDAHSDNYNKAQKIADDSLRAAADKLGVNLDNAKIEIDEFGHIRIEDAAGNKIDGAYTNATDIALWKPTAPTQVVVTSIQSDTVAVFEARATVATDAAGQNYPDLSTLQNGALLVREDYKFLENGAWQLSTTYPNGLETHISTATNGTSTQVDYPVPGDPNTRNITQRNAAGDITASSSITPALDEQNNPIPNTYDTVTRSGAGTILSSGTVVVNPADNSVITNTLEAPSAAHPDGHYTSTTTDAAGTTTARLSTDAINNIGMAANTLLAINTLAPIINNGRLFTLQGAAATAQVANSFANGNVPVLSSTSNVLGGLLGAANFLQAIDSGNTGSMVSAAAPLVNAALSEYAARMGFTSAYGGLSPLQLATREADTLVFGADTDSVEVLADTLPYAGALVSLANGHPQAAVSQAVGQYVGALAAAELGLEIGAAGGPVGMVIGLVVGYIIGSMFGSRPPPPWGTASVHWDSANNKFSLASQGGEGGGEQQAVTSLLDAVNGVTAVLSQYASANPATPLGMIAQRLGSLDFGLDMRAGGGGYSTHISSIDTGTGQDAYPLLRFDYPSGQAVNASTSDAVYFQSMKEFYLQNALARGAIAPAWEVQTAHQQQDHLLSNAGLSEVERAARLGQLANSADKAAQHFNPIALDLNGAGGLGLAATQVQFDVDGAADLGARLLGQEGAHYLKQTQWLNAQDGFLVLDKNLNGVIDNGSELFSNAKMSEQSRGIASLVAVDGDGNGVIDSRDPVFRELRVWRDANTDGVMQSGEAQSLGALGITSLNYGQGMFEMAGQVRQMSTMTLNTAETGFAYAPVPGGIQVTSTNGEQSIVVTKITNLLDAPPAPGDTGGAGGAGGTGTVTHTLHATGDGISTQEDQVVTVLAHGTSTLPGLLDNDDVSNSTDEVLTLSSVQNAKHGVVSFDVTSQSVSFTPDANFNGTASFDYTVDAGSYGQTTGHVQVEVRSVNDAPVITGNVPWQKPIYGYQYTPSSSEFQSSGDTLILYAPGIGYPDTLSVMGDPTYHDIPVAYEPIPYTGTMSAIDPDPVDTTSTMTWSVVAQPHHGSVVLNAQTGAWQFVNPQAVGGNDAFILQVKDAGGAFARTTITVALPEPYVDTTFGGGLGGPPIILDLNSTGFHFTSVVNSNAFFQNESDGWRHRSAWFGGGNGVLAVDTYHDGVVHDSAQISFKNDLPSAQTDLQGLAAFDTNHDGKISNLDARWSELGAWVDANQDGVSQAGEYQSLGALGIASVGLDSNNDFSLNQGVTVHGQGSFTRVDGSSGATADVTLPYSSDVLLSGEGTSAMVGHVGTANPAVPMVVGDGDQLVLGYLGDNTILVGNGNNTISTGDGNDTIVTGNGNNTIATGAGRDVIAVGHGNNTLLLGDGPKMIVTGDGNNLIIGGSGNSLVLGGGGSDVMYAGSGSSVLFGGRGDDMLVGGKGYNGLIGGDGNDLLMDGGGKADMVGNAGDDTFTVTNAADTVREDANEGNDRVVASINYTLGTNVENLTLTGRSALSGTGNELDNQIIGNGAADNLQGMAGNDTLADSGGAAIMAGGVGDDTYIVTNAATTLVEIAGEGYDTVKTNVSYTLAANVEQIIATGNARVTLTGNELDNVLTGNAAANILIGGAGNDTYVLQRGGGRDTVIDSAGAADSVLVRGNLSAADITLTRRDADVVVGIKSTADALVLKNWLSDVLGQEPSGAIESIRFESGAPAIDSATIHSLLDNHAPTAVADSAAVQEDVVLMVSGNVLANDADADLVYDSRQHLTVTNAGVMAGNFGSLTLAADGSYSYTLNNSDTSVQALGRNAVATDVFNYTVQDHALDRKTASAALTIRISGTNDAPIATASVTNQAATEDAAWSFVVPINTFADVDAGDSLTFTGTLADGTALPSWLSFNAETRTFSGTPLNGDVGNLSLRVTAIDLAGAAVASSFNVTVANTNDAPIVAAALTNQAATEDAVWSYIVPADTFTDVDVDDRLILTGTRADGTALPSWLTFNETTRTFSGTPLNEDVGNLVLKVTATDIAGATVSSSFTVTVINTNDAPIAFADTANVKEDQALAATGNVLANDADVDVGDTLKVLASTTGLRHGTYGDLNLNADGSYSYALNNAAANVQALGRNTTVSDTFAYTVTDDSSTPLQATSSLSVRISGTNDGPQALADTTNVSEDGTTVATGNVLANDGDVDVGDTLSVASPATLHGTYGDLALAANGSYSYTLNNAAANVQSLRAGQQVSDVFTYTTTDGLASAASNLVVTVTGSNDGPTAVADTASVSEDGTTVATGNVLTNDTDVDVGDTLSVASPATLHGTYGDLTLGADGSYSYALNNSAANVQSLRAGQQVSDIFADSATDGLASAASNLVVTVTGSNDGPQALADVASVSEDGSTVATGNVLTNDTDVDVGDTLSVTSPATLHGTYGDLALAANGSYSYTLNNTALNVQSLRAGQQVTDSFAYSATDGLASAASNLVVTVTGTNDAPIAFADTASVKEDQTLKASGNVLTNDTDVDVGDTLKVLASATGLRHGTYGDLTLNADGSYSYALNNSADNVQALGRNITVNDTFAYTVTDDSSTPLQASTTLSVRVSGTNDGPQAAADTASVSEDGATIASGNVLGNDTDVDVGDVLSIVSPGTLHGTYGDLVLAVNGGYSYTLNNAALNVQSLRVGQQVTDTFAYSATDGPASSSSNLVVTVTGINDAPIAFTDTASVKEDVTLSATGNVLTNDTDVDVGDTLKVLASATGLRHGSYGDLTLNADGSYSYALNNSAANVQALGRNTTVTDTFTYTVTDDSSTPLQASSTLSVRISGTNDGPQALADVASVSEDGTTLVSGNVLTNDSDVDVGDTLSVASPATLHGTYGDLALSANGNYSYTLNNAAANVQSLRAGQQVTDSFTYSATDGLASATSNLTVTVTGTNDAPIVATPLTNRQIDQNQAFTYAIPVGTFTDVDAGDSLSLSAKLASGAALPSWLSFDAVKQTFTGTAPSTVSGLWSVAVTATDRSGATGTSSFALDISNVMQGTDKADALTGTSGRDYMYGLSGNDTLSGGAGNDYLQAGTGNDTLDGGDGSDILAGGNGADVLRDLYGNNTLLGGSQNDVIEAGGGNDFIGGGKHDDTISAGGGTNVIAYNEGDGRDTVLPGVGARNTLSLGGDIVASELAFHRKGLDLVMDVDSSDSMTFKDWYASAANKNFVTLQIMDQKIDKKDAGMPFTQPIETFDFLMLVNKFDAATAVNPKLSSWTLMNGLLDAHLASSTSASLGGELAARYAESAMLVMAPTAAQDVLRDASFGTQAQSVGTRVNDSVQTFRMG